VSTCAIPHRGNVIVAVHGAPQAIRSPSGATGPTGNRMAMPLGFLPLFSPRRPM